MQQCLHVRDGIGGAVRGEVGQAVVVAMNADERGIDRPVPVIRIEEIGQPLVERRRFRTLPSTPADRSIPCHETRLFNRSMQTIMPETLLLFGLRAAGLP